MALILKKHLLLCILVAGGFLVGGQIISALPECPHQRLYYCRCNTNEEAQMTPMHMCVYTTKIRDTCHPCPSHMQQYVSCASCPDNACPVCSPEPFGRTAYNSPEQLFYSFSEKTGAVFYRAAKEVFKIQLGNDVTVKEDIFSYKGMDNKLQNVEGYRHLHNSSDDLRMGDIQSARTAYQELNGRRSRVRRRALPQESGDNLMKGNVSSDRDSSRMNEDEAIVVASEDSDNLQARSKRQAYPIKILVIESEINEKLKWKATRDGSKYVASNRNKISENPAIGSLDFKQDNVASLDWGGSKEPHTPFDSSASKCYTYSEGLFTSPGGKMATHHFLCKISEKEVETNENTDFTASFGIYGEETQLNSKELYSVATDLLKCLRNDKNKHFKVIPEELRIDVSNCPLTFLPQFILGAVRKHSIGAVKNYEFGSKNISVRQTLTPDVELQMTGLMNYTLIHASKSAIIPFNLVNGKLNLEINLRTIHNMDMSQNSPSEMILDEIRKFQISRNKEPKSKVFVWFLPPLPMTNRFTTNQNERDHFKIGQFPNILNRRNFGSLSTKSRPLPSPFENDLIYRSGISKFKFYKLKPEEHHMTDTLEVKTKRNEKLFETEMNFLDRILKDSSKIIETKSSVFPLFDIFADINNGPPLFNDWVAVDRIDDHVFRKMPASSNMNGKSINLVDLFLGSDMNTSIPKNDEAKSLSIFSPEKNLKDRTDAHGDLHQRKPENAVLSKSPRISLRTFFSIGFKNNSLGFNTPFEKEPKSVEIDYPHSQKTSKEPDTGVSDSESKSHDIKVSENNLFEGNYFSNSENHPKTTSKDNLLETKVHALDREEAKIYKISKEKESVSFKEEKITTENGFSKINDSENEINDEKPHVSRRLFQVSLEEEVTKDLNDGDGQPEDDEPDSNQKRMKTDRQKRHLPHNSWCTIPQAQRHGTLDCTLWSYKKECSLRCHPGWNSPQVVYRCNRKENKWQPQIEPCQPDNGPSEPISSKVLGAGGQPKQVPIKEQHRQVEEVKKINSKPSTNNLQDQQLGKNNVGLDDTYPDDDEMYDANDYYDDDEGPPKMAEGSDYEQPQDSENENYEE